MMKLYVPASEYMQNTKKNIKFQMNIFIAQSNVNEDFFSFCGWWKVNPIPGELYLEGI